VGRLQRHNIFVVGSFIMGLDTDERGIGKRIADTAERYGVDLLNTLFLTPLPGTRLWDQMKSQGRIAANDFPSDWRYYTLGFPTAHYRNFSWSAILEEMNSCDRRFYSLWGIFRRVADNFLRRRQPILSLVSNLSYRNNTRMTQESYGELDLLRGGKDEEDGLPSIHGQSLESPWHAPTLTIVGLAGLQKVSHSAPVPRGRGG